MRSGSANQVSKQSLESKQTKSRASMQLSKTSKRLHAAPQSHEGSSQGSGGLQENAEKGSAI